MALEISFSITETNAARLLVAMRESDFKRLEHEKDEDYVARLLRALTGEFVNCYERPQASLGSPLASLA
jgi:hypothetical protein